MTIALIAHDGKKPELVAFVLKNKQSLKGANFITTATTGKHVSQAGFACESVLSGPSGGDAQIAARVANGDVDVVIFFRDPLGKHPHEPDVQMLMRICDVHDVPLATNPASAELILEGLLVRYESAV